MRSFGRAVARYRAWRLRRHHVVYLPFDEADASIATAAPPTPPIITIAHPTIIVAHPTIIVAPVPTDAAPITPDDAPIPVPPATTTTAITSAGRLLFRGSTILGEVLDAQRAARRAEVSPDIVKGRLLLVFFTDGSREQSGGRVGTTTPGGYDVVHKIPGTGGTSWSEQAWEVPDSVSVVQTELLGEAEAMAMAVGYVEQNDIFNADVKIFTDSQETIMAIRQGIAPSEYTGDFHRDHIRPILISMARLSERLDQRRCRVDIHWLKRSTNTKHVVADALSRDARTDTDTILSVRSRATAGLDSQVLGIAQVLHDTRADAWSHEEFSTELVARVLELQRMGLSVGAMNPDDLLELRQKRNWIFHLLG